MIAQVMLTDARHIIDRPFDYLIPASMETDIVIGSGVLVPFGRYNQTAEGVVIELLEDSSYDRLKPIKKLVSKTPFCTEEQIDLCFYMVHTYISTFRQAYKLMIPPKFETKVQEWVILHKENQQTQKITAAQKKVLDFLEQNDGYAELSELKEAFGKNLNRSLSPLRSAGIIQIEETLKNQISVKYIRMVTLLLPTEEGYAMADQLLQKRAHVQANMLLELCENGDLSTADLVSLSNGNYSALSALEEKGFISIYKKHIQREVYQTGMLRESCYAPTEEQKPIIKALEEKVDQGTHDKILLRGVTGSGKTEIFLQVIEHCILQGKQAIMLVPEIALTPQMVERFVTRFGTSVAVMHSGLSNGERFDQWAKIKNGEVHVVVGARSAIFAPFQKLGIIILDEEHETSYKSELSPRYHAADIAFWRGEKHNAPVLLASATPLISSYYKAQTGAYTLFEMTKRYNQNPLPEVKIVDMRSELMELHNTSPLSSVLQNEIKINLERGEKTILFLNRRGFNTFISCRECGYVVECENCSIPLTYHKNTEQLICHYCGNIKPNITICPSCGSKHIRFFGTGTQRIEQELHILFPNAYTLRMDFDTTSKKGGHEAILNQFKSGNAQILLGTQMVTKGLDFPDVTLVGVLAADTSLGIDDFRAHERTFSLITQVCGRAGRGAIPGRAIIQTYQPQNPTIRFAKEQDYLGFYENEIKFRRTMDYPPFSVMLHILSSGEDENKVREEIGKIAASFRNRMQYDDNIIDLMGPAPAPITKIKNNYRYHLILKIHNVSPLENILKKIQLFHDTKYSENNLVLDINPTNMN